jgi:PAS domain S-box-containing protein
MREAKTIMSRIKNRLSHLILGQKGGKNRIQIIKLLKERPYNLNQMAEILSLNYRTVKHHTDVLLKNELLNTSRTGGYGEVYFLSTEMEGNMELFEDIVNKFRTSKKLKDFTTSPKFYRNVMEQTNDAIIIINKEGQVSFWNKSAEKLYGYKGKEILGESVPIFPDQKRQTKIISKAEKGRKVVGFETKGKHKSGELVDVSLTMDGIKDENENIIGFSILSRDITKRRKAEEALRESEELHRITLSAISDTVVITDDTGNFTFICPNIDFIFGYKKKEVADMGHISKLLGNNLFDAKHLKSTGEIKNIEIDVEDKPGKKHTLLMNVKNVSIKGGTTLYTCHDITQRKQTEEALELSEERYALAQRAANIGSWDWDILTGVLTWSDTIEPMFGFDPGKFGATYEAFLNCIHPEDRQYVIDSVDTCVKDGEHYNIEHRIVWPDGTTRWVSETGDVIRDEDGKAIRMLGIVQDITLKKAAQELNPADL